MSLGLIWESASLAAARAGAAAFKSSAASFLAFEISTD